MNNKLKTKDIIELLSEAKQNGIFVFLDDGKLRYTIDKDLPTGTVDKEIISRLSTNKIEISEFLNSESGDFSLINTEISKITPVDRSTIDRIPLSFSQERLYFIDMMNGSIQYHIPAVLRLKGKLNKEALIYALQNIINRHEVLRTVIRDKEGFGYQDILEKDTWKLEESDGSKLNNNEALQTKIVEIINTPFDLSSDHMMRASLIKLNEDEHILLITLHHIASDGWSISVIVKELVESYKAFEENREPDLAPLEIQYADYSMWQRNYLKGEVLDRKLRYWKDKLQDSEPLLLPEDFERPDVQSTKGAVTGFGIEKDLSDRLNELSQNQGVTLFMTLLSAFNVLLYRYTGQDNFIIGSPIAGRQQEETEALIGFFINTLSLRSEVTGEESFEDLLQKVKISTLGAYENQEVPFEKIVDSVVKERDMSRSPVFQVTFALQNTPKVPELKLGDLTLEGEEFEQKISKYDLVYSITETPEGLHGVVEYCTDLFKEETMQKMIFHFKEILLSIVKDPQQKTGLLNMLSKEEEHKVVKEFNDTKSEYPSDRTIVELFEEQVAKTPDTPAVVFENEILSYSEFDKTVNRLANYIIKKGIKPGENIGLLSHRGIDMIAGIFGIIKAGCAYVPFNTDYPEERLKYIIEDCDIKNILYTDKDLLDKSGLSGYEFLNFKDTVNESDSSPGIKTDVDSCLYVMFTSGTTGRPKGIAVSQRNVIKLVYDKGAIAVNPDDHILQWSNYSFDGSTYDIFSSLLKGASLHMIKDDWASDADELARVIKEQNISVCFMTTALFNAIVDVNPESLKGLRKFLFGGEMVSISHVNKALSVIGKDKIVHVYGPTETVTYATSFPVNETKGKGTIPIGKPLSNTKLYIVDKSGNPVPVGVAGELLIGGDGVSLGYVNNEELTNEKFIDDPFDNGKEDKGKVYRTGDLCRWLPEGVIEYLGRIDDQVKIRGYRIEPAEIENVLNNYEFIKQSVIIAKNASDGSKRLVGYVVPEGEFSKEGIMKFLSNSLPDYMVPSIWVEMENLPLNASGKVNKRELPDPDMSSIAGKEYVAPRNDSEAKLAKIWKELLDVEKVGIHDNFFDLGGHSLLAMRVIAAVRKELGAELTIKELFLNPNIADLSEHLGTLKGQTSLPALKPGERPEHIPLSFSQKRLWFIDKLEGSVQYHLPAVLRLKGKLNREALAFAVKKIVDRHEVIRTVIKDDSGKSFQVIKESDLWQLNFIDGSEFSRNSEGLKKYIEEILSTPFNLSEDFMLRGYLIELNENENVLVFLMHHIASDGWSMSIIVKELAEFYRSFEEGREADLEPLPIQYADYAIWQKNYLSGEVLNNKIDYWKNKLDSVEPIQLPTDFPRPEVQSLKGALIDFNIGKELTDKILDLTQRSGVTLFMTLLSAFNVLLHRYSGQDDICIGTVTAGRQLKETENLIGFFVNTLALRNQIPGDIKFTDFLRQVKSNTLDAYEHQDVSFEKVVEAVVKQRDMSRSPLFQVSFALQNIPDIPELRFGDVQLLPEESAYTSAKFDLTFFLSKNVNGINISLEYCTDLYTEETVKRMLKHYEILLDSIVKDPDQRIDSLQMLSEGEEKKLLSEIQSEKTGFPKDETIVSLFQNQAAKTPDNESVKYYDQKLTYKELNERSNQLANYLISKGVKSEMLVPVIMERSINMIVGILGILKAGGVYVPIDPDYPESRIDYIVNDTAAKVILASEEGKLKLSGSEKSEIINIDSDQDLISEQSTNNTDVEIKPDNLAYVIYTSGSTGNPKGVLIEHSNVVRLFMTDTPLFDFNENDVWSLFHSFSFDFSVWEMYGALFYGGKIIIVPKDFTKDPNLFSDLLLTEKVTILNQIPLAFYPLQTNVVENKKPLSVRYVIFGGEALDPSKLKPWNELFPECKLINMYGITETTVHVTYQEIGKKQLESGKSIIGKPIPTLSIYILNSDQKLQPDGIAGEMCIGGEGLARGYLNRPELTKEKFINNPFSNDPDSRLYRSGDLGMKLHDGSIEYKGRIDQQVKIRGFRIELGEIESCFNKIDGIKDSRVVMFEGISSDDKRLNAYLEIDNSKLPLLSNYQKLLDEKIITKSDLHILPNGLPVMSANFNEVKFLYQEIFEDKYYLKNGIVLNKDSCVIDIGANVGFFTVFLNILSKDIKVYSFEPIPDVYNYLDANRKLYGVKGKSFQLALMDEEQEIEFVYYPSMSILSGATKEMKNVKEVVKSYIETSEDTEISSQEMEELLEAKLESKKVNCQAKTLSSVISDEKIEKIDLLKIDVENSEHLVIAGIDDKDWDKVDNVIIEIHDVDGRLNMIKDLLEKKGFKTTIEKEEMLSKDAVLYNLYAVRKTENKGISGLGENEKVRSEEWKDPVKYNKEIRTFVEKQLPAYMVPSQIVFLNSFPKTGNWKLDIKALPQPDASEMLTNKYVAPTNDTEKALAGIWEKLLGVDKVGINDNFFELGGHSLLALELFSNIEKLTGRKFLISTLFKSPTIKGLAEIIKDKGWTPKWKSLVCVNPGGDRLPLYCVPNAGGTALQFQQMTKHISKEQPVYVMESIGLNGDDKPHTTVKEMAAYYIKEIQMFQPNGPYLLGGRCFGGRVIYEMAQQLTAAGEEVALLAIFDTWPPFEAPPPSYNPPKRDVQHFTSRTLHHLKSGEIFKVAKNFTIYKFFKIKRKVLETVGYLMSDSKQRRYEEIKQVHIRAQDRYVASKYPGKITLIECEEYKDETREKWKNLARGGFEYYTIPGTDHISIVTEPKIRLFADKLNYILDRTDKEIKNKFNSKSNSNGSISKNSKIDVEMTEV